jgi:hypothetical protein
VRLSTFEVRQDRTDRFEHCPPAGDIGQATLPPIPEWHPSSAPAPDADGGAPPDTLSDTVAAGAVPASVSTLTWEAIKATSSGFRGCYHGETWGACGLAPQPYRRRFHREGRRLPWKTAVTTTMSPTMR